MISSVVAPPTPVDHQRQTCEAVMSAVRKIRLYMRDPNTVNSGPPLLIRNLVGLITASERQFHKISQQYDFYRIIDEDLFVDQNNKASGKLDKSIRNMSLAADLINARHDHRISQKHFLLADEIAKKDFTCTPRQVIALLNRYGHTCSYKSYMRMKTLKQQTTNELGADLLRDIEGIMENEDQSSDSDINLLEY